MAARGKVHRPTDASRKRVRGLVASGLSRAEMSRVFGVSVPTLLKHYRHELDLGTADRVPGPAPAGHAPTDENRETVSALAAVGMSPDDIAAAVGVHDDAVLLEHYAHELTAGAARERAEGILRLRRLAKAGNVTAVKAWIDMAGVAPAAPTAAPGRPSAAKRSGPGRSRLGKKEEAKLAAETAGEGTEWGSDLIGPQH